MSYISFVVVFLNSIGPHNSPNSFSMFGSALCSILAQCGLVVESSLSGLSLWYVSKLWIFVYVGLNPFQRWKTISIIFYEFLSLIHVRVCASGRQKRKSLVHDILDSLYVCFEILSRGQSFCGADDVINLSSIDAIQWHSKWQWGSSRLVQWIEI